MRLLLATLFALALMACEAETGGTEEEAETETTEENREESGASDLSGV